MGGGHNKLRIVDIQAIRIADYIKIEGKNGEWNYYTENLNKKIV